MPRNCHGMLGRAASQAAGPRAGRTSGWGGHSGWFRSNARPRSKQAADTSHSKGWPACDMKLKDHASSPALTKNSCAASRSPRSSAREREMAFSNSRCIVALAFEAIAASSGTSASDKVAQAQAVFESSCRVYSLIFAKAASDKASSSGWSRNTTAAYDHAVLAKFCTSKFSILRTDSLAIASKKGSSMISKAAKDHAMLASSCGWHSAWILRIDAADSASMSGVFVTASFAKAHEVLAKFCPSKFAIRGTEASAIASNSGPSGYRKFATAQAVLDRFCGLNCLILDIDAEDRAASKGLLKTPNAAKDHARIDRSWQGPTPKLSTYATVPTHAGEPNSAILGTAHAAIASIKGQSRTKRVANAHAESARCCGPKSSKMRWELAAIASNSGKSRISNMANDHDVVTRS
mmetsp:Transcript_144858/g.464278  ORF Transcript_144858/g.464278 Transcript_144858/m.464278 type:complete len:407 (-) Transcript_144858:915-2135(-)